MSTLYQYCLTYFQVRVHSKTNTAKDKKSVCAHVFPKQNDQYDQLMRKCPVSTFRLGGGGGGVGGWWGGGGGQWLSQVISLFDGHSSEEAAFVLTSLVLLAQSGHYSCRARGVNI